MKLLAIEAITEALNAAREEGWRRGIDQAAEFCDRMASSGAQGTPSNIAAFIRELLYPGNTPATDGK
jgi:hypothetical protein